MSININIPPDSQEWLFSPAPLDDGRLWSLGRFRPACDAGDDIFFRFDGDIVAAATVHEVYKPGLFDAVCHNGKRFLSGWKVTWMNEAFIDLRDVASRLHVACNDRYGTNLARFDRADFLLSEDADTVELEAPSPISFRLTAPDRWRIGRRLFRATDTRSYVGNIHWDAIEFEFIDGVDVLNHLVSSGFRPTSCPTALCDSLQAGEPIGWRDLLKVRQEAVA